MTTRNKPVAIESTEPGLSSKDMGPWSFSIAAERARSETRATALRRRLEAQFVPRVANPADVESIYVESLFRPDVDEQVRRTLGSVAALAAHGFFAGDEGWYPPLLAELERCSGDKEISLYRLLMYGIFLAAGLANPGQSFKSVFGSKLSGWSLALPLDDAQRARSLENLKRLFESLLNNRFEAAEHAMIRHLEGVQRVRRWTGWPAPSLAYPVSYLFFFGRLDGPD
jgi:hypothetical protein